MKFLLLFGLIFTQHLCTAQATELTPFAKKTGRWKPEYDSYILQAMPKELPTMDSAYAATPYCPKYATLDTSQKEAFWAFVLQAVTVPESGMIPNLRYVEKGMGKDLVTKSQIVSAGLLQLSYQDSKIHKCDFNWSLDKVLPEKSLNASIHDPKKNLQCGIKILKKQIIDKKRGLFTKGNYYWSVLREGSKGSVKVKTQLSGGPSFCH